MKKRFIKTIATSLIAVIGLSMYSKPCNAWSGVPDEFKHVNEYLYEFNWSIPEMFMGQWIYNNEHRRGDVDADGEITPVDATLIERCMLNTWYCHENRYMDVDCDKDIDSDDAYLLLRYCLWRDTGLYTPL